LGGEEKKKKGHGKVKKSAREFKNLTYYLSEKKSPFLKGKQSKAKGGGIKTLLYTMESRKFHRYY
jgi:hypothetical protein